ncbi:hypothetical protein GTW43_19985 [Streptomyces sp. SID5785]|uniref:hypothetical protein n=1 Tax=Streptomyces sp. SID5785 TaxID=2690309 RepID=UPI001360E50B|nr:hypothetical protein [Streptomyces sp. SID5785]MZD07343.1 hypothetical protein [Streptomyces sp. SID5785]
MRKAVGLALGLVGTFFICRALVEPFLIDYSDPSSYANDWGGPHLLGVLAVHCLPGVLAAWLMFRAARRHPSRVTRARDTAPERAAGQRR